MTEAKKRRKKKTKPQNCPRGISPNTLGRTTKPRVKDEEKPSAARAPRNIIAVGITLKPARTTSQNSFIVVDVRLESAISSFGLT